MKSLILMNSLVLMKSLVLLLTLACPLGAVTQQSGAAALKRAERLIERKQWAKAEEAFEKLTATEPDNGRAWFLLGYARHAQGDHAAAIEASLKAAEFASERPMALYNVACGQSLLGREDEAARSLEAARAAGFLDFDLMKSDADLAALRAAERIDFPPEHEYRELKAPSGIVVRHAVVLPKDFEPERSYPVLIAFPPGGGGAACADWALENLWGGDTTEQGWIVVVPVAPKKGWINHPSHHALNALLKRLSKEYRVEDGKFHMAGFGAGARPATTFASMSKQYFQSLSVASSTAWSRWDDREIVKFEAMPIHQFVGETDEYGRAVAQRVLELRAEARAPVSVTVLPGEGPLVPSLGGGAWLRAIDERLR